MAFVRMSSKELCAEIVDCIVKMLEDRGSGGLTVVIDGKAAAGKSKLAKDLRNALRKKRVKVKKTGRTQPVSSCTIESDWFLQSREERAEKRKAGYRRVAGHKYIPEDLHLSYWNWEGLTDAVSEAERVASGRRQRELQLDNLYDRRTGKCKGRRKLKVNRRSVILVEGSYLLAKGLMPDISIVLYVNREIGRMRKIQREEKKEEGEFPAGERVGEVVPTWEELEEPTFCLHLMLHGRDAHIVVDTSDVESMAVMKFSLPGYKKDDFQNALKWDEQVRDAERAKNIGKLLALAQGDRPPANEDAERVLLKAGRMLQGKLRFSEAAEIFGEALDRSPSSLKAMTQKALMLERLRRMEKARKLLQEKALPLLRKKGSNADPEQMAEMEGVRGRVYKQLWRASWQSSKRKSTVETNKRRAIEHKDLLLKALRIYEAMFRREPTSYYNGDNAAALYLLYQDLTRKKPRRGGNGRGLGTKYDDLLPATRVATQKALSKDEKDFWARTTLGNLAVMAGDEREAKKHYERALAECPHDKFMVDSVIQQLEMFAALGFRTRECEAVLPILKRALKKP